MRSGFHYLVGVDGGGTGTRARLADAQGRVLAEGRAGPSGLARGVVPAWCAIGSAIDAAFTAAGLPRPGNEVLAVGIGIAGARHAAWAAAFTALQPHFGALVVEDDALTTLLGAHEGRPGAVLAVGTGSVGAVQRADGALQVVGGWGFPSGDEGSGAWLGRHALAHLQQVVDGRLPSSDFAWALLQACGGSREGLLAWTVRADQTCCAGLAPLVVEHAAQDATARALLDNAGRQLARLADTLDPGHTLPLALCGGLAAPLRPWLPPGLRDRALAPRGDSAQGALHLVARNLEHPSLVPRTGPAAGPEEGEHPELADA